MAAVSTGQGANEVPLLRLKKNPDKDTNVEKARFKVDMALLKMERALDEVQEQVIVAKEELHERRSS